MKLYILSLKIFFYLIPDWFLMTVIYLTTLIIPIRRKKYYAIELTTAESTDEIETLLNSFIASNGRKADLVTIIENRQRKGGLVGVFKHSLSYEEQADHNHGVFVNFLESNEKVRWLYYLIFYASAGFLIHRLTS